MHPISKFLCETYNELYREGQVKFPLHERQREAVDSVVKTVNANYFGRERFPTPTDKATAYLCLIIKNHPVTDGNKRLGILWFQVYCTVQELSPNPSPWTLDQIAVAIEKADSIEMEKLMELVKHLLFLRK